MKRGFVLLVLSLHAFELHAFGQKPIMDLTALRDLRDRCIQDAPISTLAAIVQAESGGNPYALQIDFPNALLRRWRMRPGTLRLARQPKDSGEALAWMQYLSSFDIVTDIGLMQVSTAEALRRKIDPFTLFEPCTNLRIGWQILQDDYAIEVQHYGPGQTALEHALSRYNTGTPNGGIDNGYYARIQSALAGLSRQEEQR
jgi:type IV secretion system protein VirB1